METDRVERWPDRPRPIRWLRTHPRAADLILALGLTALAVTVHLLDLEEQDGQESVDPAWWTVVLVVASVLPIAWRRSHTILSTSIVVVAQITTELADVDGAGFVGVIVGIYSLGAHSEGPNRSRLVLVIAVSIGALFIAGVVYDELDIGSLIASTVLLTTAFVVGDNLRQRREAARDAEDRAAHAERERELLAQQQLNAERSRIARELHDVVAHSVSVMVIQAAAARRSLETSPDNAREALSNIEETGRQTMNELRGILGVLRRSEPIEGAAAGADPTHHDRSPQPTLAQVDDLIRLAADLPIVFEVDGDLHDLPTSVALTGYRVVQEALTNVRRHAGPVDRVEVTLRRDDREVDIEIADDGRGSAADQGDPGYGLLGMTERVAAIGGRLSAGSRRGGGWRIRATLPLDPRQTTDAPVTPSESLVAESPT